MVKSATACESYARESYFDGYCQKSESLLTVIVFCVLLKSTPAISTFRSSSLREGKHGVTDPRETGNALNV